MTAAPASPKTEQRLLAAVALLAALASVYVMRVADADLWGHLRYGRFFAEHGAHAADPFAYTSAGKQWYSHEYLAQVVLWRAYAWGGPAGLIVLKCLLGGAAMGFLVAAVRGGSGDARVWGPVVLLTAPMLGRWFLFRPQLFTFLFFALFVWMLFRHLRGRPARLWLLAAVMALWANLHGGFLAGLGAVGLALLLRGVQVLECAGLRPGALWRATRPLALTLAACLAATLFNPLGWRLWLYLVTELTWDVNRRFIDEWQPLSFTEHPWSAASLVALVVLLGAAALLAPRRPLAGLRPWQWLASCLPLALMTCRANRHLPLCVIWSAPVLALLAQAAFDARCIGRAGQRLWLALTGIVAAPALVTVYFLLLDPRPVIAADGPVLGSRRPDGAVAFMRAHGLRGCVYNPLWWGSYLTWELYPDVFVAMDGRNVTLFAGEQVEANLAFYLTGDADPATPLRGPADFLLVPTDAPVLGAVRADPRWAVVYDDGEAVLFARADTAPAARLPRQAAAPPAPRRAFP